MNIIACSPLVQYSPYAHRVHIALEEAKAVYVPYVVNLADKPAAKVNPAGKVRP